MSKENGKQTLAPPTAAGPSGRASPSGRISPAAGRMSPMGRTSPSADQLNGEAAKMPGDNAAPRSPVNDKLIRILTVIAYLCSVSGAAFMLSLYYIFLWDPAGHGESKPAALQAPEHHHNQHHPTSSTTSALPSNSSLILRAVANTTERIVDSLRT